MELLVTLFWIGFWITLAMFVFSIAWYLFWAIIAIFVGGITWIYEKIKGER